VFFAWGSLGARVSEEDVEAFLYELEQELAHLDGDERRDLVQQAEDRLHEVATRIAAREDADHVEWYHYVQASAELGPPERLAAELADEPLPDRRTSHRWMIAGALSLVLVVAGMVGYAWWTTGDLEPVGSWSADATDASGGRELDFTVDQDAESVFLSLNVAPTNSEGQARVTVLDGANRTVYDATATSDDRLETATFVEGQPGTWRVFVDLQSFTGTWSVEVQQEV